jgi:competence ComEA-like helix-hairpin-helix protein
VFRYFTKRQRIGIVLLFLIVVGLQVVLYNLSGSHFFSYQFDKNTLAILEQEYDSLQQKNIREQAPKRYPFNPNYISLNKGYELGMTLTEIKRLHDFRASEKWINSTQDFKRVTGVSDSLLATISPYFKFPKWVIEFEKQKKTTQKKQVQLDLNLATAEQLQKVNGVGPKLSERIIRYRQKFDIGFANMVELKAVYGLSDEIIENIKKRFAIPYPRPITQINLNTANQEDLVKIPFIDYELAYSIIETRMLKERYNTIEELTKIKDFPLQKIDIISLYLYVN